LSTSARTTTALNPRSLVQTLSIETLIEALVGDTHPFAFVENGDGSTRFVCPHCGYVDHNGGSAVIVDSWRFRCRRCRFTGTRILIERLILESATAMDSLYRLVAEGAS
jgi:hypothetical protein